MGSKKGKANKKGTFGGIFAKICWLSVVTVVGLHLYTLVNFLDIFKSVVNHGASSCQAIDGIKGGSEDIRIIPEAGVALVTAGLFPHMPSAIHLVDLKNDPLKPAELMTFDDSFDKTKFHPHGAYIWSKPGSKPRYFVVNHHDDFECVDVFDVDVQARRLQHVKRIMDPTMRNMNSLVVVDGDKFNFYFTNWLSGRNKLVTDLQNLLTFPAGDICYYADGAGRVVSKYHFMPNGLALSPDQQFLYVASYGSKSISHFYRRPEDGALAFVRAYPVHGSADNLDIRDGKLWTAGTYRIMPAAGKISGMLDASTPVPSFVSRCNINPVNGSLSELSDVIIDDGKIISFATMAVQVKNRLLVGTVDNGLFVCPLA